MTAKNTELLGDKYSTNAILDYYSEFHSVNIRTELQLMRLDHMSMARSHSEDRKPVWKIPDHQTNTILNFALYGHTQLNRCFLNCYQGLTRGTQIWSYSFSGDVAPFQKKISPMVRTFFSWSLSRRLSPHHSRVTKYPTLLRIQDF